MWSSMMAPQGPNFQNNFMCPKDAKQQHRDFGMFGASLPIASGKSFKNPNFVNNFNKYQNNLKPVDSSVHNNFKNSCQIHLIDSIKEKCPEVIPFVEEQIKSPTSVTEPTSKMCFENNSKHKQRKREHTPKSKKQIGKKSRQNRNKKEISEMMQEAGIQDLSNHSQDNSFSPEPHSLILKDFMIKEHLLDIHPPFQMMEHIEIPIANSTEVLLTTKPLNRNCQYSVTENEDSFIIFDHQANDNRTNEDTDDNCESIESPCGRRRLPSLCESEDSFIMFDRDNLESHTNYASLETSSDDSDEESSFDEIEDTDCDDVDSSFSIVDHKKVRFAPADELCDVHPMVKWSYAYQAARKGPWEMYARDRCRFKERAYQVERSIKHIFDPHHRDRIYRERFENL